MFALVFVLVVRALFYKAVDLAQLTRRVVIFGAGNNAARIIDRIQANKEESGFQLYGCMACGQGDVVVDSSLLVNEPEDWMALSLIHI